MRLNGANRLSHTKRKCKYQTAFAPKCHGKNVSRDMGNGGKKLETGSQGCESRDRSIPCAYAGGDPTKTVGIKFQGNFEGKEKCDAV